jgi:hypothetical protein
MFRDFYTVILSEAKDLANVPCDLVTSLGRRGSLGMTAMRNKS